MSKRRVVVTGLGAVTPIGNNVEDFWAGIREGKVGIGPITKFDTTEYKVKIAAQVKGFDARERLDFKSAKRMELFTQYAAAAAKEAFEDAGITAMNYDDKVYKAAGLSPVPFEQSPTMIRLMERNMLATMGEWKNFTRTTASAAQRLYIEQCDLAYNHVMTGAVGYTQAIKEAVNNVVSDGVTVTYPSGRKDTIETAVARSVRTGVAQACADIQLTRMKEMGYGLVLTSAHIGSRPSHEVWQGQVFSIDWEKLKK